MSSDDPVAGGAAVARSWIKLPAPANPALAPGARVSASAVVGWCKLEPVLFTAPGCNV